MHSWSDYDDGDKGDCMKKRILAYRNYIDRLLSQNQDADWNVIMEEHLQQIAFFQHERLIHLIVTVLFALMELGTMGLFVVTSNIGTGVMAIVVLILLIPYINHYYLLENEVQKMYVQYDKLLHKIGKGSNWNMN